VAFRGAFYERIFGLHELRFLDDEGEYTGFASRAMSVPDGEPDEEPKMRGLLLDGSTQGGRSRLLMQIFGEPPLGPAFIEFIQHKNDDGLGEGNFKAFFEHPSQAATFRLPGDARQAQDASHPPATVA
jgi:4-hydroxyphenylpyruvate dioxygenase-like putative hemolysin